ncbi:MAG: glycosyltransferase [bacterium]
MASRSWLPAAARCWILDRGYLQPRAPRPASAPDPAPLVSVVVPARNEAATMAACLERLTAAEYAALEIVVLDDQSTDRTGEIARTIAARDPRVRVITERASRGLDRQELGDPPGRRCCPRRSFC